MTSKIIRKKAMVDYGKADVDLLLATKAIIERDLDLKLVDLDRLKFSMLSAENRKVIAQEMKLAGYSTREIANRTGWDQSTIVRDLKKRERSKDGDANASVSDANASPLQLQNDARKAALHRAIETDSRLHLGDFRKLAPDVLDDESVELVFIDPPYDRGAVPLYEAAVAQAERILKPGGSMVCYCGHVILPLVLPRMAAISDRLKYFWLGACVHDSPVSEMARMNMYGIIVGWKPLLWFVKDYRGDRQNFICDTVWSKKEKDADDWQQTSGDAEHFISSLTSPQGVVVDFFAGSGTTIAAAQKLGRQWHAFEIDKDSWEAAQQRIAPQSQAAE